MLIRSTEMGSPTTEFLCDICSFGNLLGDFKMIWTSCKYCPKKAHKDCANFQEENSGEIWFCNRCFNLLHGFKDSTVLPSYTKTLCDICSFGNIFDDSEMVPWIFCNFSGCYKKAHIMCVNIQIENSNESWSCTQCSNRINEPKDRTFYEDLELDNEKVVKTETEITDKVIHVELTIDIEEGINGLETTDETIRINLDLDNEEQHDREIIKYSTIRIHQMDYIIINHANLIPRIIDWPAKSVFKLLKSFKLEKEASVFLNKNINGTKFLLLNRDEIFKHFGFKLGPALKIWEHLKILQWKMLSNE
ncbi:hypothetical protein TNCV_2932291 [Trichonephila clavipes]|nr:hypothetical protein TNCV_2932291 [Trichonephila clavipes]